MPTAIFACVSTAPIPALLTIGEMLVDELPSGARPGGGPFNCAGHFRALGGETAVWSALGGDAHAETLTRAAARLGVDLGYVGRHATLPTGRVGVRLDADGEARYDIVHPVAWDALGELAAPEPQAVAGRFGAVATWLLGTRDSSSAEAVHGLLDGLAKRPQGPLRVADLGQRPPHTSPERLDALLRRVTLAKLNAEELAAACEQLGLGGVGPEVLAEAYGLDTVVVTRGAAGAGSLRAGVWREVAAPTVGRVADTVGCGDAFLAGYLHARLVGADEDAALRAGVARGAYAATVAGGLPEVG